MNKDKWTFGLRLISSNILFIFLCSTITVVCALVFLLMCLVNMITQLYEYFISSNSYYYLSKGKDLDIRDSVVKNTVIAKTHIQR